MLSTVTQGTDNITIGVSAGKFVYNSQEIYGNAPANPDEATASSDSSSKALSIYFGDASTGTLNFTGAGSHDKATGTGNSDTLSGGGGSDSLIGGGGDDTLVGGAGNDLLSGGAGSDLLSGGDGNDTFQGSASDFNGDTISDFGTGDSLIISGVDLVSALDGQAVTGTISLGGDNSLTLTGLSSGVFSVTVQDGKSTLSVIANSPSTGGGGGSGGGSGPLVVTDNSSNNTTGGDRVIANMGGTADSAAIIQNTGNNGNLVMATLPPSISIASSGPATAQSGTDALNTLVGAIEARGSTGEAGLIGGAQSYLNTLASTSTLDVRTIVPTVGTGITTDDPIVITGSSVGSQSEAFVIDMRSITDKILQVDNIEFVSIVGNATVNGGAGDNFAVGDDNAQFISLGVGDDTLSGGSGNDTIGSGDGDDSLFGNAGDDTVFGGTGLDVLYGNQQADVLYGNQAADTLYGGQDGDTVYGGQDADIAYGNLADDVMYGNLGDDTLFGGQGNDILYGGEDNDRIYGGGGDDTIVTGSGADMVVVQANGGSDVVTDFDGSAGDTVQIDSNVNGTTIDTYTELVAASSETGAGVQITLGSGNALILNGITVSQLQSDWFVFD